MYNSMDDLPFYSSSEDGSDAGGRDRADSSSSSTSEIASAPQSPRAEVRRPRSSSTSSAHTAESDSSSELDMDYGPGEPEPAADYVHVVRIDAEMFNPTADAIRAAFTEYGIDPDAIVRKILRDPEIAELATEASTGARVMSAEEGKNALITNLLQNPVVQKLGAVGGKTGKDVLDTVVQVSSRFGQLVSRVGVKAVAKLTKAIIQLVIESVLHAIFIGSPDVSAELRSEVVPGVTYGDVADAVFAHHLSVLLARPPSGYGDEPQSLEQQLRAARTRLRAPAAKSAAAPADDLSAVLANQLATRFRAASGVDEPAGDDDSEWGVPADAALPALRAAGMEALNAAISAPVAPDVALYMPPQTVATLDTLRAVVEDPEERFKREEKEAKARAAEETRLREAERDAAVTRDIADRAAADAERARAEAAAKKARRDASNRAAAAKLRQAVNSDTARALQDSLVAGASAANVAAARSAMQQAPGFFDRLGGLFRKHEPAPAGGNAAESLAVAADKAGKASSTLRALAQGAGGALDTAGPVAQKALALVAGIASMLAQSVAALVSSIFANPETQKALEGILKAGTGAVGGLTKEVTSGLVEGVASSFEGMPAEPRARWTHFRLPRHAERPLSWDNALQVKYLKQYRCDFLVLTDHSTGRVYVPRYRGYCFGKWYASGGPMATYRAINGGMTAHDLRGLAEEVTVKVDEEVRERSRPGGRFTLLPAEFAAYLARPNSGEYACDGKEWVPPGVPNNILDTPVETSGWTTAQLVVAADWLHGLCAALVNR